MPESTLSAVSLPPSEALAYFRQKVNVPTEHYADLRGEAHARAFAVAGATSEALLRDLRAAVERALSHGDTEAEFRANFDAIVKRYGWDHTGKPGWRAGIIYQTNVSTAYSAGQYRQMTTPEHMEMFPFWRYRHGHPMRPRPQHLAWNGTVLPAGDPWWNTHWPPNGWRCQCSVDPVSERDMRRAGKDGPDAAPPLDLRPWRNPRTGEVIQVPHGVDPGFGHNPGREWLDGEAGARAARGESPTRRPMPPAQDAGSGRPAGSPTPAAAEAAQRTVRRQHAIQDFLDDAARRPAHVEVGTLSPAVQQLLDARTAEVRLSSDTMEKQLAHHAELEDAEYQALPEILARPDVVAVSKNRHLLLLRRLGKLYRAVVKATGDGSELYLVSFHRTSRREAKQRLRSLRIVHGSVADLDQGE